MGIKTNKKRNAPLLLYSSSSDLQVTSFPLLNAAQYSVSVMEKPPFKSSCTHFEQIIESASISTFSTSDPHPLQANCLNPVLLLLIVHFLMIINQRITRNSLPLCNTQYIHQQPATSTLCLIGILYQFLQS